MLQKQQQSAQRPGRNLHVGLATSQTEVLEAQKLRYRVFADEMGARLTTRSPGVDRDLYDAFCEHLIVRDEDAGRIVGTYRILSPSAAREVGNYYSETEFDITRLRHLKSRMVEIGRSCIDADYRSGAVITLLWSGLARYMLENKYDYLIGCASVSMADGGHMAASLYNRLKDEHLCPLEYRVFPRTPLPLAAVCLGWGAGIGGNWVLNHAALQRLSPDAIIGRLAAFDELLVTAAMALAAFASAFGPVAPKRTSE